MLAGTLGELTVLVLFGFAGAYGGVFKRREAKLYGLDLLWVFLLTIAVSFVPYIVLQAAVAFAAVAIYGGLPKGAYQASMVLGLVMCTFICRRLVEWREGQQAKKVRDMPGAGVDGP